MAQSNVLTVKGEPNNLEKRNTSSGKWFVRLNAKKTEVIIDNIFSEDQHLEALW